MRGEVSRYSTFRKRSGIIPAGAGRSCPALISGSFIWDHPRGCGEKVSVRVRRPITMGSSPRVRGEAIDREARALEEGIIPAGAGRSIGILTSLRGYRDHPRGCGEKAEISRALAMTGGSSPRVRGEDFVFPVCVSSLRIIPAGAGRSYEGSAAMDAVTDHPRGCGEKLAGARFGVFHWGSSPRVRGEESASHNDYTSAGIIPAGAGRSGARRTLRQRPQDHPRGCGEKTRFISVSRRGLGSSPRVRGEGRHSRVLYA